MQNLLSRLSTQPLMLMPGYDIAITQLYGEQASVFLGARDQQSAFTITKDGIAILQVHGTLIDRAPWLGSRWGFTSYEGLEEQYRRLAEDDEVKAVILDVDSGGGMVAGVWDNIAGLERLKQKKPVYGVAQNMACSAAYAIGCAAHEFYVTRASYTGSVGVLREHMNIKKMMKKYGIKRTFIFSGDNKVAGHPYGKLPKEVRAQWQSKCDKAYEEFTAHVAQFRNMDIESVISTQAAVYDSREAVETGFADGIATIEDIIMHIRGEKDMTTSGVPTVPQATNQYPVAQGQAPVQQVPQAPVEQAPQAPVQQVAQAPVQQLPQQVPVEQVPQAPVQQVAQVPVEQPAMSQTDIFAVMFSEGGKRHPDAAKELITSGVAAQTCINILAGLPVSQNTQAGSVPQAGSFNEGFAAQMAQPQNSAHIAPDMPAPTGQTVAGQPSAVPSNVISMADMMKRKCEGMKHG